MENHGNNPIYRKWYFPIQRNPSSPRELYSSRPVPSSLAERCPCLHCRGWGLSAIQPRLLVQPQYRGLPPLAPLPPSKEVSHGSTGSLAETAKPQNQEKLGQNRLQCSVCKKSYSRASTLKVHMRIHRGEKPYGCSYCPKSFIQSANLVAHLRVHTGEKPYECPICHKRFSQSSSVKTHIRTHTGERPFACEQCGKVFSDRSTLSKHRRVHKDRVHGDAPAI